MGALQFFFLPPDGFFKASMILIPTVKQGLRLWSSDLERSSQCQSRWSLTTLLFLHRLKILTSRSVDRADFAGKSIKPMIDKELTLCRPDSHHRPHDGRRTSLLRPCNWCYPRRENCRSNALNFPTYSDIKTSLLFQLGIKGNHVSAIAHEVKANTVNQNHQTGKGN